MARDTEPSEEPLSSGEPPLEEEASLSQASAARETAAPEMAGDSGGRRPPGAAARLRALLFGGWRLNAILFAATLATTWMIGGPAYCATLVGILICHEMGHYLTARYYGVKASLPYFIPVPLALGTFGAVIKMDASIPDKRALVAIGASGPLAGLAVAVPLLLYGLSLSTVAPTGAPVPDLTDFGLLGVAQGMIGGGAAEPRVPLFFLEGNSILYLVAKGVVLDIPEGYDVWIHPVAFAAWIGLFVTALNMLPVGQLDGGHVAYGLWGEKANRLNGIVRGILLGLGLTMWVGWLLWVVLISFILRASGGAHPPVQRPERPVGGGMRAAGWAALLTLALTFSPAPLRDIRLTREEALSLPPETKSYLRICEEWIEWRFDLEGLGRLERLRRVSSEAPPACE